MKSYNKSVVFGVPVSCGIVESDAISYIENSIHGKITRSYTFVNPYAVSLCKSMSGYKEDLYKFDMIFCDGIGMVFAANFTQKINHDRISFDATSLAPLVFNLAEKYDIPVYFVGSKPGVTEKFKNIIESIYKKINIAGVYSGYGVDPLAAKDMILKSNSYSFVIVGMGVGYQEKFSRELVDAGFVGQIFTCGGYFDQTGVDGNYYPKIINKLNIRFLYRIAKEPRRLLGRYFFGYMPFVTEFFKFAIFKNIKAR